MIKGSQVSEKVSIGPGNLKLGFKQSICQMTRKIISATAGGTTFFKIILEICLRGFFLIVRLPRVAVIF